MLTGVAMYDICELAFFLCYPALDPRVFLEMFFFLICQEILHPTVVLALLLNVFKKLSKNPG